MSTTPAKVIQEYVSEGLNYSYKWAYGSSLVDEVVSVVFRSETATGVGTVLATASGASADVVQTVSLEYGAYATGNYLVEIYKDYGASGGELLYPPENVLHKVTIQERVGN